VVLAASPQLALAGAYECFIMVGTQANHTLEDHDSEGKVVGPEGVAAILGTWPWAD
jgi:hypothetical protein